ncbi:MAG TPA: choice-of-anchor Q domain-containing protein, partial [Gemmataceae bacterium]|nr:choice-of-anchor Q domain-containing protein [Gemmataceae bacterium]
MWWPTFSAFKRLLHLSRGGAKPQRQGGRRRVKAERPAHLYLEMLEDRMAPAAFLVTDTSDSAVDLGSIRYAVSHLASTGSNTIDFSPSLAGQTITLANGPLALARSVTVSGLGANQLTLSGNHASQVFSVSAGITVSISDLTITSGSAYLGAGIGNAGTLRLNRVALIDNVAGYAGGGLRNDGGSVTLNACTIAGNSALYSAGISNNNGSLLLVDSTVANNSATSGSIATAGGLGNYAVSGSHSAPVTIIHSTFSGNIAVGASSGRDLASVFQAGTGVPTITVQSSIFASSSGSGMANLVAYASGKIISLGYNINSDSSGGLNGPGDLLSTNPRLAPLGNYGGTTQTFALLPGSPALDAANAVLTTLASTITASATRFTVRSAAAVPIGAVIQIDDEQMTLTAITGNTVTVTRGSSPSMHRIDASVRIAYDQRGVERLINGTADIGAFESRGFKVTVTSGDHQATVINTSFPGALQVTVTGNDPGAVLSGGVVTFNVPNSVAGASFGTPSVTLTSSGIASSTASANGSSGAYVVNASAGGANDAVFRLTNAQVPSITVQPVNQGGSIGAAATFTAAATGYPTPTVQWKVSTDGGVTVNDIDGATGTTLTVHIDAGMSGYQYEAVFTNDAGAVPTNPATLLVGGPAVTAPSISSMSTWDGPAAGGTTVTLTGANLGSIGTTTVRFGTTTASIVSDDGSTLVVTSPPGAAGRVPVTVTTSGGTAMGPQQFIYDGTATQLQVTLGAPSTVNTMWAFEVAVAAEDSLGNVDPTYNGNVTIALADNPGGATLGGTHTVAAHNGIATFSGLTLNNAGSGYTLRMTGAGIGSVQTYPFTVTTAAPVPTLIAPAGSISTALPTISWNAQRGAASYEVKIVDAARTSVAVVDATGIGPTSLTLTNPLTVGHGYLAYVRAFRGDGTASAWSVPMTFTVGLLSTPVLTAPKGSITNATPTFVWNGVTGADAYEFLLKDLTPTTHTVIDQQVTTTSFTPAQPLTVGHSYQWLVRALNQGADTSSWSAGLTFTISVSSPVPIGPIGPLQNASPTFTWNAAANATHYTVKVTDIRTGQTVTTANVAATSWTRSTPWTPGDTYQWSVQGVSATGVLGSWSNIARLFVQPLDVPQQTGPNGSVLTTSANLTWNAVAGADDYEVKLVDVTGTPVVVFDVSDVAATSYSASVVQGHKYQWYVRAFSNNGDMSAWSAASGFVYPQLSAPGLSGPIGAIITATPTFTWSAVAGVSTYEIRVNDLTTGQANVIDQMVSATTFTSAQPLKLGHMYQWQVKAQQTWSSSATFTVSVAIPTPLSPTGIQNSTPTFTWTPAASAATYEVQITDLVSKQVIKSGRIAGTSWTPTVALTSGDAYQWSVRGWSSSGVVSAWSSASAFATPVWFADPDLAEAVRSALGLAPGAGIQLSDIANLTSLTADANRISSLVGLQFATNLQSLSLTPGDLTTRPARTLDLSPLNGLSALSSVALQGVGLNNTSLTVLAALPALQTLDVRYNAITSVANLAKSTTLQTLYLYGNPIPNILPLKGKFLNLDLQPQGVAQATTVPALAQALQYMPLQMYAYVLNNFTYQPYAGSMKGAQAVLDTGAGNDWDMDALLSSLLTQAGVSSRYVSGRITVGVQDLMNWLGVTDPSAAYNVLSESGLHPDETFDGQGHVVSVTLDHTWLEVAVPVVGGTRWVAFDPSWKFRDFQPGVAGIFDAVPFDSAAENAYFAQTRTELTYQWYEDQVAQYLAANDPGVSLADVAYDGPIHQQLVARAVVDLGLPYQVVGAAQTYSQIPDLETHRVQLLMMQGTKVLFSKQYEVPQIALSTITVSYGGTSPSLIPQLRINGQVVVSGPAVRVNSVVTLEVNHLNPGSTTVDTPTSYSR